MLLDIIKKGTTDYSCMVRVVDSTDGTPETSVAYNTAGVDLWYRRPGSAHTSITEATQTEAGAHSDGGFVHISDGYCRLDLPDAAVASGVDYVDVGGTFTGMVVIGGRIRLTDVDLDDSVRAGLTALPNAAAGAAGGLPTDSTGKTSFNDVSAADVNAQCDTALTDYDAPTKAEMDSAFTEIKGATWASGTDTLEAIRDRGDAAWTTGAGGSPPQLLQSTTIATLASQTSFTLTAGSADDDAYNGAIAVVTDQSTSTQKAVGTISDYTGSTKTVTLSADPAIFTMAVGDTIEIIAALDSAGSAPTAAQIRVEIDSNSTQLAAIVADTNELQTDWANGGRLDLLIDAIKNVTDQLPDSGALTSLATAANLSTVDTVVDGIQTDLSNATDGLGALKSLIDTLTGNVATVDTVVDAVKAITDNLPDSGALTSIAQASDLATAISYIDTEVAAILEDTGTTLPALINALNDLSAAEVNAEIVDALVTDTYAEGSIPAATASLKDMIHWIFTMHRNKITQTSTTTTVRNDADSADLATFTVSDDATTFTSDEGS